MSTGLDSDVVVIGGGPAGTVAALALARLGRSVVLCEAAEFPRAHIGISLSPGVPRQLAFLGLERLLDRADHRTGIPVERRWNGAAFERAEGEPAIVADRGVLDADLLDAARGHGVHVLQPASVTSLRRTEENRWHLDVATPAAAMSIEAAFVIEATGRRTRFRRRQRNGAPTVAVVGHWRGPAAEAMRISALGTAWCWGAPTGPENSVLAVFADPREFRRGSGSIRDRYLKLAHASAVLPRLEELHLDEAPVVCDATPYATEDETARLLRVGDADIALDPLSSSGVQAAIQSALAAGPVVNTLLTPAEDDGSALEFWNRSRANRMMQHRRWAAQLYREAFNVHSTAFWGNRCETLPALPAAAETTPLPDPDQRICVSDQTRLVLAPCLTGSLVKRLECVEHAGLAEPVAFVGGVYFPPLLRHATYPMPAREIMAAWSTMVTPKQAWSLLGWAWRNTILTQAAAERSRGPARVTPARSTQGSAVPKSAPAN